MSSVPLSSQITIIITGPTASGKSAVALDLAQTVPGVIINGDSLQVYNALPLLTAQPALEDQQRCPHRLYGTLDVNTPCSVSLWAQQAAIEIERCYEQEQLPVIVGGTGFYLKTLQEGLPNLPLVPSTTRQAACHALEKKGLDAFRQDVIAMDPDWSHSLSVTDPQRLLRAWEIYHASGYPLSYWQRQPYQHFLKNTQFVTFCLDFPRHILGARANQRFLKMMQDGALEEVRLLKEQQLSPNLPIFKALGARPLLAYLDGKQSFENALLQTQAVTRAYIKRQQTWFRTQLKGGVYLENFSREEASRHLKSVLKETSRHEALVTFKHARV